MLNCNSGFENTEICFLLGNGGTSQVYQVTCEGHLPVSCMTEKQRRELCKRYQNGESILALANDYGRSVNTIKGLLNTYLHNGKFRTEKEIRRHLTQTPPDEKWKSLQLPTKTPYLISSYGRIKNTHTGAVLNLRIVFGYFSFEYTDQQSKRKKAKLVHILVAQHWLKSYTPELNTTHLDYDRFNNYYRNLKQVTVSQRAGRVAKKGSAKHFKLNAANVRKIKSSSASVSQLAQRFNITTMQVQRIQQGDCWSHILPEKNRAKREKPGTDLKTVIHIKSLLAQGKSGVAIAAATGVTTTTVSRIKRGKTYRNKDN